MYAVLLENQNETNVTMINWLVWYNINRLEICLKFKNILFLITN